MFEPRLNGFLYFIFINDNLKFIVDSWYVGLQPCTFANTEFSLIIAQHHMLPNMLNIPKLR